MKPGASLVLYHRYGCHLCEDMLERLHELEAPLGFALTVRDIDDDPEWGRVYGDLIPVLEADGREICRYFLDEQALRRYLERR